MERWYGRAEELYWVHGGGDDPTEPSRSTPYPFPALPHEPPIAELAASLRAQGLHPFAMASAVDRREGGRCVRCRTCDGFPCRLDAKGDADVFAVRPALQHDTVRLLTRTCVGRLETSGGLITEARAERDGAPLRIRARRFALACGAANSAALLLRSGDIANSSGLVGRNYMVHNSTFFMGVDPRRRNPVVFQKTLGLNDWYLAGSDTDVPLGNVQMLGKLQGPMLKAARAWLPMRLAGYPIVLTEKMGIATNSHMCGTAVMGEDPATSVLDPGCRSHDVPNLWVVDSSCFPSSGALNPALRVAARREILR